MLELTCAVILFDMDGVLVDSGDVVRRVWQLWSELRGHDPAEILRVAQGRRTADTLRLLSIEVDVDLDVDADVAWLSKAELDDRDGLTAVPGAAELLERLPPERWAVVTSAGEALARARLGSVGLPEPACLVSADRVAQGKPSPEGYLLAARELGARPEDCVVFEDSLAGVTAGKAAGMRVVALTTTHAATKLSKADAVLPDLRSVSVELRGAELVLSSTGA